MLAIEHLYVDYGARPVLCDVSLSAQSGEVLALIGPNGAGKSTLIRAASGVIPIRSGRVRTNGTDFAVLNPMQRARHLAVVPQAPALPPAYTVWETVLLGRTPYLGFLGQTSDADDGRARAALERVRALELAGRRIGELSGGEVQRVLLARALCQAAPVLLLDEPTAHLDLRFQVALMRTVRELARDESLAVVVAMHDLNLAARFADRVALMVNGEIQAIGTPAGVLVSTVVSRAYGLPVDVFEHPLTGGPLILPARGGD